MKIRVGIVGTGGIATRLKSRLSALTDIKVSVAFFINRSNKLPFEELLRRHKPKVVFIAISTLDKGKAALGYILACLNAGIIVVTCEKGAFGYYAKVLMPYIDQIGVSAVVGGGTGALEYLRWRHLKHAPVQIYAVINGSLNFIWHQLGLGAPIETAFKMARDAGYTEPAKLGADSHIDAARGEMNDVFMKAAALGNLLFARHKFINPDSFLRTELTPSIFRKITHEGTPCRLVVSFSNHPAPEVLPYVTKAFELPKKVEGWSIQGAFIHTDGQYSYPWLPPGVNNVFHVSEGDPVEGRYNLSGDGAGDGPTTAAMINDMRRLLGVS